MPEYDSPYEKLRQEFEILMGMNNEPLTELPAYTIAQLYQLVDAYRRKHDVAIEEVRQEDNGVYLVMLGGGEITAAIGIDDPAQVEELDVLMLDDREIGGEFRV